MIERKIDIKVKLAPDELASEFCNMDSEQQVIFFNEVAELVEKWSEPFSFQLQWITDDPYLSDEARFIMRQIGDYSYKD